MKRHKQAKVKEQKKASVIKELKKRGIDVDLIDIEGDYDSKLTLAENIKQITKRYNTANKNEPVDLSYASRMHQARSQQAQRMDEAVRAKHTYTEKQLKKNPGLLDNWFKNPAASDIFGIDAFEGSKPSKRKR